MATSYVTFINLNKKIIHLKGLQSQGLQPFLWIYMYSVTLLHFLEVYVGDVFVRTGGAALCSGLRSLLGILLGLSLSIEDVLLCFTEYALDFFDSGFDSFYVAGFVGFLEFVYGCLDC